jgi:hypothetical protein
MNMQIFAVLDTKAGAYLQPFFLPNENMAIRTFGDCCMDPEHNFGMHPEDYHLVQVGIWEQLKGTIIAEEAPITLVTGTAIRNQRSKAK